MAYMDQQRKKKIAPAVKAVMKKYGVKGSLAVQNHSTLVLNIKSGKLDFIGNYSDTLALRNQPKPGPVVKDHIQVNEYWYHEQYTGKVKDFLTAVITAMNVGNHDNSNAQVDYFDVGWYVNVNVGRWNKPYILEK